ncbi:MAG: nucleotide pyrophosphohydrolase [Planctomycetaceae bacterium]|jgi:NTP pyrophosphatase (non-canonical NTP hydrolase)|nr:nucleotide pyrophosphohydrolase [Planctomycetaceae bacterium]
MKTINNEQKMNDKNDMGLQEISFRDFQGLIRKMYYEKDNERGATGTFLWLMEEVGELASAIRNGTKSELRGEFADVLAWLATIANVMEIDLTESVLEKYGSGCPGCGKYVCECPETQKP